MTKQIERVTQAMMESGLERFYWTIAKFRSRFIFSAFFDDTNGKQNKILGFNEFFIFFVMYMVQNIIAIVVWIIELTFHRMKMKGKRGLESEWN